MAEWFPQGCNYIYNLGYGFYSNQPAYMDIKLSPDDPNGAFNSHASCTHPNNTTCYSAATSDGLQNMCEGLFPTYGVAGFSDPPIGVLNGYQIGIGLVNPTMYARRVSPGVGVYPLSRKPVRSYHNGMWAGTYGLPVGWYLFYRIHPARLQTSPIVYIDPLYRYDYTYITTPDGRNLSTTFYYKDGLNANAAWVYGGSTTINDFNKFHSYGYVNTTYKWDICCSNSYINNNNGRYIFDNICGACG